MSRRRRKRPASQDGQPPAVDHLGHVPIPVFCRDACHLLTEEDAEEYKELGYHLLGAMWHDDRERGGMKWSGRPPEQGPLRSSLPVVSGAPPTLPIKKFRRPDGQPTYRFTCTCGRDPQRTEPDLAAMRDRWLKLKPDDPFEIDITRL